MKSGFGVSVLGFRDLAVSGSVLMTEVETVNLKMCGFQRRVCGRRAHAKNVVRMS